MDINIQLIEINHKEFLGKTINDFNVIDVFQTPETYGIVLEKSNVQHIFFVRRHVIPASKLRLENDVVEIWYKNFEASKMIPSEEISDTNKIIEKISQLLTKYNK